MEEFKKHLAEYQERRRESDRKHQENLKRLDRIEGRISEIEDTQKKDAEETMTHHAIEERFQRETGQAIQQLNELIPVVREQLLPAYQEQMDRKKAYKIVRGELDGFSWWAKLFLLITSVVVSVLVFIKFYVIK